MSGWSKLGIIAGGGALPRNIANACSARGEPFCVLRIAGAGDPALGGVECGLGEIGKALRILKDDGCDAVVFAGALSRPDFAALKLDIKGAALLPKVIAAAAKGDGAVLALIVKRFEAEGFKVIAPEAAGGGLPAPAGSLGAIAPDERNLGDIKKALGVVQALGPFDVGQGAVVAHGFVLAIEAAEGTDAMLARCATLPNNVAKGGVLVKAPKPGQELRVDLPVIGPETVRRAAAARLKGIALVQNRAIIVDDEATKALADSEGLFVYGLREAEAGAA